MRDAGIACERTVRRRSDERRRQLALECGAVAIVVVVDGVSSSSSVQREGGTPSLFLHLDRKKNK